MEDAAVPAIEAPPSTPTETDHSVTTEARRDDEAAWVAPRVAPELPGITEPSAATSNEPEDFRWDARWGRSGIPNFALVGASAAMAAGGLILGTLGTETPVRGLNGLDETVRSGLRLDAESDRLLARDISDVGFTLMLSAPLILDAFILAAWQHNSPDIAFELVMMHAEVASVVIALQITANVIVTRERPYGRTCGGGGEDDLPGESQMCSSVERNYSFFSGHASQTFAAAAVVCSAHMNMPLLGGGAVEMAPCVAGLGVALATATLRIVGDMHYFTDVLVGAVVGTTVGFVLPWALHYQHRAPPLVALDPAEEDTGEGPIATAPPTSVTLLPTGNGVSVFGVF